MKENDSAYYRLKCFFGLLVLPFAVSAQIIPDDYTEDALKSRQAAFELINAMEDPIEDSLWYQGRIYEFELGSRIGTPYFLDIVTHAGELTYNGKVYEDLLLSFNLVLDELIIEKKVNKTNTIKLVLNKYFVEDFTLIRYGYNYHFRLHTEMKPIHAQLEEGFYEVVYDDELMMFARHKKELFFDASKFDHYSYQGEKQVFLVLAGKIYKINNRRNYLKAFQDYKKPLRKYMKQAKINIEKSGTQALSALCEYSKSLLDN